MLIGIVDDQEEIRYSVSKILRREGYETIVYSGLEEDLAAELHGADTDLLIVDVKLSEDLSGIDILKTLRKLGNETPAILMTAYTTPSNMIEASKIGVKDVLQKPFTAEELKKVVDKYISATDSYVEVAGDLEEEFVGSFETMKDIYSKIGIAANNDLATMIVGDTGTGKELIARHIHKNSARSRFDFLPVNCASIPGELFESQFFGYEKGAFTGADTEHAGFAESVGEGTLFLDEIGELDFALQSKLLRFLENRTFKRVGGNRDIAFRGRIVSATNIDIEEQIRLGKFREDLYFRLATIRIDVPSLEARREDIPILVNFFIGKANEELGFHIKGISDEAMELLKRRHYQGNIRELRNVVYNAILNSYCDIIQEDNIQFDRPAPAKASLEESIDSLLEREGIEEAKRALEIVEKAFYRSLLKRSTNITHLAQYLDVSRSTLRKTLKKYDLIS